jgi:hypothetical protein
MAEKSQYLIAMRINSTMSTRLHISLSIGLAIFVGVFPFIIASNILISLIIIHFSGNPALLIRLPLAITAAFPIAAVSSLVIAAVASLLSIRKSLPHTTARQDRWLQHYAIVDLTSARFIELRNFQKQQRMLLAILAVQLSEMKRWWDFRPRAFKLHLIIKAITRYLTQLFSFAILQRYHSVQRINPNNNNSAEDLWLYAKAATYPHETPRSSR